MRKPFFLLFLTITLTSIVSTAQTNDYIVSLDGIGSIKLGMSQSDLEKLLKKKLYLTNPRDTVSGIWYDSAKISYKNMTMNLDFQRNYTDVNVFHMMVVGIRTNSVFCRTKEGIGVGADKQKIFTLYENTDICMGPDRDNPPEDDQIKTAIRVRDDRDKMLIFYLVNKKVVGFKVKTSFNEEE